MEKGGERRRGEKGGEDGRGERREGRVTYTYIAMNMNKT